MKVKRYNLIPALLLIYLCVMSYIGYPAYVAGKFSATYYFGTIALTLVILVLLRFFLKKKHDYNERRNGDNQPKGSR